jgi:hypothetical protein
MIVQKTHFIFLPLFRSQVVDVLGAVEPRKEELGAGRSCNLCTRLFNPVLERLSQSALSFSAIASVG